MIWWPVLGACIAIALSATFSGMETGVYSLERVRLQVRAAGGDRRAARLLSLVRDPTRAVCTILVVNNAVNYAVAMFCGDIVKQVADPGLGELELELLNTLWVVPILFIFGEVVPKQLFLGHPAALTSRAWPLYRFGAALLRPVVGALMVVVRKLGNNEASGVQPLLARQGVVDLLTAGDEAESLHATQRGMAQRVLALRGVTVRDRMVNRARIASVERDADRDTVIGTAAATGRSRLLVAAPDDPLYSGYVNALDAAFTPEDDSWEAKDALFDLPAIAPDAPVLEALRTLQEARRPVAQVVERGRAIGLLAHADVVGALLSSEPDSSALLTRAGSARS